MKPSGTVHFDALLQRIRAIGKVVPFGINYVVNSDTIRDLNAALEIAVVLAQPNSCYYRRSL